MPHSTINLLLIEDSQADANLIRALLRESGGSHAAPAVPFANAPFEVEYVDRITTAVSHLVTQNYDVILLDLSLPDSSGLESFSKIKLFAKNIPVIILSGLDDQAIALKAVQQGAQDYLVKGDIDAQLLIRAIRYAIERQNLLTEQLQAKSQLASQAAELQTRNAELDQFAYTVAHQVQGLLGQIVGYGSYLDMIYKDQLDEEGQLAVSRIVQSGRKMDNVLNEILLLTNVNRDDIQVIPLNMGRLVAEAYKRLSLEILEYQAQIFQPDVWPTAVGYPPWIEEVWLNYISNALKYGGDPPVLHLGATDLRNGIVRFWLKDNGAGLTKPEQEKLFKTHTRLHQKTVRGEGLGLSIVRRIVEKCGGQVGVESEVGQGSTFWFTLPVETDG
jgi:two-component system, sensor histidine kinase and response regulator